MIANSISPPRPVINTGPDNHPWVGACDSAYNSPASPAAPAGFVAGLRQLHAASVRILAISDDFFAAGPSTARQLAPAALIEQCRAPVAEVTTLGNRLVAE
ncbi:MAG: hypothetical protein ACO3AT_11475, partial [Ilumatobacteraceae bacterium]